MIPSTPRDFDPRSREGDVFISLSKLSEEYYVFHSMHVVNNDDIIKRQFEREMDFVVVHPKKGILILEAKAGTDISYRNGRWFYSSGKEMDNHDGPYNQAQSAIKTLRNKIKDHSDENVKALLPKLSFHHGVVFVEMTKDKFNKINLPPEATPQITMLAEDLASPAKKINEIFSYNHNDDSDGLSPEEFDLLFEHVLCPEFHLIPSGDADNTLVGARMNQLLYEQYRILDFIEDQSSVVISGAAGTGKTMVAIEKARRHSLNGEKVLFLCYNRLLCSSSVKKYKECDNKTLSKQFRNVSFYTINKLIYDVTGKYDDYENFILWLKECVKGSKDFGFDHVIIDEGQDFGLIDSELGSSEEDAFNNCSIIDAIQDTVLSKNGTFCLFYDRFQTIQGHDNQEYLLPSCIENCDCRLSLKTNCRNTTEIAKTSLTPIKDQKKKAVKIKTSAIWTTVHIPVMHVVDSDNEIITSLNTAIEKLSKDGIADIVILSMNSVDKSCLFPYLEKDKDSDYSLYPCNGINVKVSTCRRFKGLEAEAVILVDVDAYSYNRKKALEFYVGSSRAKLYLELICKIHSNEYYNVVHSIDQSAPNRSDPARMREILGNVFSVKICT